MDSENVRRLSASLSLTTALGSALYGLEHFCRPFSTWHVAGQVTAVGILSVLAGVAVFGALYTLIDEHRLAKAKQAAQPAPAATKSLLGRIAVSAILALVGGIVYVLFKMLTAIMAMQVLRH